MVDVWFWEQQDMRRLLDLQKRTFDLGDPLTTRVEVPFEGATLPAYFTKAPGRAPVMIMWNGLDSTEEHMYSSGFPLELAARGISTLMVDTPGSGEALRLQGLTVRIETETWAAPSTCTSKRGQEDHRAVPVAHGENNPQIPVALGPGPYDQGGDSPQRELQIFTPTKAPPSTSAWTSGPHVGGYIVN